jgi:hypothetical protein
VQRGRYNRCSNSSNIIGTIIKLSCFFFFFFFFFFVV